MTSYTYYELNGKKYLFDMGFEDVVKLVHNHLEALHHYPHAEIKPSYVIPLNYDYVVKLKIDDPDYGNQTTYTAYTREGEEIMVYFEEDLLEGRF